MLPLAPYGRILRELGRSAPGGLVRRGETNEHDCTCSAALSEAQGTKRQPLAGAVILWLDRLGAGPAAAQFQTPQVFAGAPAAPWISLRERRATSLCLSLPSRVRAG